MRFQQGHKKNLQKAKVSEASNQARYCAAGPCNLNTSDRNNNNNNIVKSQLDNEWC